MFKKNKTLKRFFRSFFFVILTMTTLVGGLPVDGVVNFLKTSKVVDSLYLSQYGDGLANIVDNFGVKEANAVASPRVKTIELFGGQYLGTGQNVGVAQTFVKQTAQLAETNADIINAYVEFSAEVGGTAVLTSTEALLYFDSCTPTPCTPTVAIIMNTAGLGTNSGESQMVRFRADVTSDATLAAYTGGAADFSYQIGYCIDGASGTDAGTCNGTSAVNLHMANAKLVLTYTYDDDSANQTNTVIFPLDNGSEVGSKVATQAACTFDSNCPTFSYNAEIPEITTQLSQFFHLQTSLNANSTTDFSSVVDIGAGANTTAAVFEEALANNGGWINIMHSGVGGYANNSAQALEIGSNASNLYALGGENYVTYTYPSNAATKTKTVVYPVGEVMPTGTTTETGQFGSTVFFPESGVVVKDAWFRVQASSSVVTSTNLLLTYQVGNNAKSAQRTYAFATDTVVVSSDGYFNFLIPASEYAELQAATGSSGKNVMMTADWSTARGNVSAELVVTYSYTGEENGYNVTQKLFAGQQTTAAAAASLSLGTINPKIAEASDTTITGVSLKMDAKGAAFAVADELLGANLHASSCTATGSSTVDDVIELDRYGFFDAISGVVTTNDATTYIPCYDTSENAIYGGAVTITYKYTPPTTRYWVGGSATWDVTAGTKWAYTSGGAGGASVPNSQNEVYFNGASGAVTVTTSGTTTDNAKSIDFTGFTGTFNHIAGTEVNIGNASGGNLTLASGMTYTVGNATTSVIDFVSTTTGLTITTAGKTIPTLTFSGSGGSYTIQDATTISGTVTIGTGATLATGANLITLSNTGTPLVVTGTLTPTSGGTILYTGNGATIPALTYHHLRLEPSSSSQQVLASGLFTINGNLTVGNGTNNGATAATNNPTINVAGTTTIASGATFTPGVGVGSVPSYVTAGNGAQIAALGDLSVPYPASGIQSGDLLILQIHVRSNTTTVLSATDMTLYNATALVNNNRHEIWYKVANGSENGTNATVSFNADSSNSTKTARIYVIRNAGTGFYSLNTTSANTSSITQTSITSTSDNELGIFFADQSSSNGSNLTIANIAGETGGDFTEPVDQYGTTANSSIDIQIASLASPTTVSGGSAALSITSQWVSVAFVVPNIGGGITFTGNLTVNGTLSGSASSYIVAKADVIGTGTINLTGGTFEQRVGANQAFRSTSDAQNWTFNNLTFSNSSGTSKTVTTASDTEEITVAGTLTVGSVSDTASTVLALGNRTWNLSGAGTPLSVTANGDITAGTSTLKFTNTASSLLVFAGAGKTYNNVWFARGASTGTIEITGANTFAELKDTGTAAHSMLFDDGVTQTMTSWNVNGTVGNVITINSSDGAGTGTTSTATHTLSDTTGTNAGAYLNIQHSVAQGGATWTCSTGCVDNNSDVTAGSGWVFPPRYTTLGNGTDGSNSTIGPGAAATEIDRFSLVTSSGTDTVTGMTVTLAGDANAYTNIATVDVQALVGPPVWTVQTNSSNTITWQALASSSDGTKLAGVASTTDYIYTSTDSGVNWTQRTSMGTKSWSDIASSSDGTKLVAVVGSEYIYTSTDSGANWTQRTGPGTQGWTSVASSSDGTKLAATVSTGYIWTSTDSGANWTQQTNSGSRSWQGIASSADGTKLAAVAFSTNIWTSTDSGANWTQQTNSLSTLWDSIASSADGTKLVAARFSGQLYTSTDSGANWNARDSSRTWRDVSSSDDGTKLVAVTASGNSGYVYTSTDSGANWTQETSAGSQDWYSSASSSDGSKLLVGAANASLVTYGPAVGGTSKCSLTPSSNTVLLTGCGIAVTTTPTEYKIMITPKTHANMAAVPGASYATTATVTAITATNTPAGTDSGSATITVDNLSPNAATSTSGSAGNANVTLGWTASSSTDISQSVVLRWAASTPGAEVPVEGTTYTANQTITTATIACVITSTTSQVQSGITDGTGGTAGCNTTALTNGQAYSYKVFGKDSRGNYNAGVTFTGSPFTPTAVLNRYWVGQGISPNWNWNVGGGDGTNWATTSGGAPGASIPDSTANVFFNASNSVASTLSANITIKTLDMTGYVGTLTHNAATTLTIAGDTYKLASGMTYTLGDAGTSATTFTSTTGTSGVPTQITTNGKTLGNTTFNGAAGYFQINDSFNAYRIVQTAGTLLANATATISSTSSSEDYTIATPILKNSGADATLTIKSAKSIIVSNTISSTNNALNLILNSDSGANTSGYINIAGAITTNGGTLTMGGGSGTISAGSGYAVGNSGQAVGVLINNVNVNAGGGNVIINGQGYNTTTNNNHGVQVTGASGILQTSGSGTITISGLGKGTTNSASNYGVYVDTGGIIQSVNGNLTINNTTGGGAGSGANNYGLYILDSNSTIKTTGTGSISITATGGNASGSGGSNYGVYCAVVNCIQTTGGTPGTITVNGTGGNGSGSGTNNHGVYVGVEYSISGASGSNVSITGTGGTSSGNGNMGVMVDGNQVNGPGEINTLGSGTLTVVGLGGGLVNSGSNEGVGFGATGRLNSVNGNLTVSGTGGGAGSGTNNYGIGIDGYAEIKTTGSGAIIANGIRGGGDTGTNYGIYISNGSGNAIKTTGSGTITVNTDTISIGNNANSINSVGALTIAPYTASSSIGVAGGTGTLALDTTTLGNMTSTSLQIGNSSMTGTTTLGAYASWAQPVSFVTNASGAITVSGAQTNSSTFSFNGPTTLGANALTASGLTIAGSTFNAGSSLITLTGTGTVFSNSGTFTAGTSTIKLTNNSATGKTFAGGGGTYNNFWYAPSTGTGTLTITGANTFNDFKDDGTIAHTITFPSSTTTTVSSFTVSGNAGQLITLAPSVAATTWTLSDTSGTNVSNYLSISYSAATGGASWYAGANSTNGTGNSGWIFTGAPCNTSGTGMWNSAGSWLCARVPTTADNVLISSGHVITMDVNSAVLGTITIDGSLTTNGANYALSGTTLNISSTGSLSANGSTITLSGTSGTLFTKHTSGTFFPGSSTVVLSGNGSATVNSGVVTFNNLTSSAGTKTLGGDIVVGGNLLVNNDSTFQLSTSSITVTGTTNIFSEAAFTTFSDDSATGTNIFVGLVTIGSNWTMTNNPAFEFRGGLTNESSGFTSGGGVYTFSTNAQTISGLEYFTITNLTNNITSGNGLTFSSYFASVTTLTQGTNAILTFSGTVPTISTLTASASGNTVSYSGASQSVINTTYTNLSFSGSGTKTLGAATVINGNFTNGSGVTIATGNFGLTLGGNFTNTGVALNAGSSSVTFSGTGTQSIAGFTTTGLTTLSKTAGTATITSAISGNGLTIDGVGGTLSLGTGLAHTFTGVVTVTNGTLSNTSSDVSALSFNASNSNTRGVSLGSGTWSLTGTGTVWDTSTSTGLTFNAGTSTIKLTNASASGKTFAGGGRTFNNFWFAPGAGTGTLTISGNNTFNDFRDNGSVAHTILFTVASTNTVSSWTVSGSAGNLITLNSTDGSSTFNLALSGQGLAESNYLNIQHSIATPLGRWFAGTNSVDNQNVPVYGSGWIFVSRTVYQSGGGVAGGESSNGGGGSIGGGGQGGGGSTTATGVAVLSNGSVQSVTITFGGSGYLSAPIVSFCAAVGSGAVGTSLLTGDTVSGVTVTSGGSLYDASMIVLFGTACPSGGGGGGGGGDSE